MSVLRQQERRSDGMSRFQDPGLKPPVPCGSYISAAGGAAGRRKEKVMAILKMALNTAADAVICFNQHGGLAIVMSVFTLTLWVEGLAGMFSEPARAWVYGFADVLELGRCFRIMRGYLARRRRSMAKRTVWLLQACDYAACRFYLNVVDRERRHQERIEKERIRHRKMVYMRVRHRITAQQHFVERYFLDV